MLNKRWSASIIAAALAGAAHGADYVTASGMPVKTGFGECVRTGYWTEASEPCEAPAMQLAMQDAPPMPAARVTQSAAVLFKFDSDELDDEARSALDKLLERFEPAEVDKVYLTTHADRIGAERYNFKLSERRLEAVRNYLATKGVTLPMLFAEARGADQPFTSGYCEYMGPENRKNTALIECLQADRRADVEVVGQPRELARTAKRAE
jgi:OOP family OmpA-OmpF porin